MSDYERGKLEQHLENILTNISTFNSIISRLSSIDAVCDSHNYGQVGGMVKRMLTECEERQDRLALDRAAAEAKI